MNPADAQRYAATAAVAVAVFVVSLTGYESPPKPTSATFDSCAIDGSSVVLTYEYAAGDVVQPSVDTHEGVVVGLLITRADDDTDTTTTGLAGTVRFDLADVPDQVTYADGTALACTGG